MPSDSFAPWEPAARRRPADFTVRLGTEADVPACARLVAARGAGSEDAWRLALRRTVRDCARRALFVAVAGIGEVVGYGRVVHVEAPPGAVDAAPAGWYLLGLAVDPAWRRRGIGEALTRARMTWVSERAGQLYYFTSPANRVSQKMHEQLGFVPVPGRWVPPGGRLADANTQQFYRADFGPQTG
jgi:ribosomal protein S18 acetylase RimI-like enzyme